jgi:3-oxoacyl-[acyl-carrier protein] reductase
MDLGLAGKVALVTGGSLGLGKAIATRLYQEGAQVTIAARRLALLQQAAEEISSRPGGSIAVVAGDVTQPADLARMAEAATRDGRIDILINNAGTRAGLPFPHISDAAWLADLELKLMAAIRLSRLVLPRMPRGGAIVNVTAIAGKHPGPSSMPSSVSRAAGIALTKAMSKDLAPQGIRVNTVCIGTVKSAQWVEAARQLGRPLEAYYAELGRNIPLGRVGEAEEVADAVAFLVSERAAYITGVALNIDGGLSSAV